MLKIWNRDSGCVVKFWPKPNTTGNPQFVVSNVGGPVVVLSKLDPAYGGADGISSHKRCP